jgi:hypothetical protein
MIRSLSLKRLPGWLETATGHTCAQGYLALSFAARESNPEDSMR